MTVSNASESMAKGAGNVTISVVQPASPEDGAAAWIDFAHLLGNQFIVYGWILGFTKSIYSASIYLRGTLIDLIERGIVIPRPDITQHFSLEAGDDQHGFYTIIELPDQATFVDDRLRLSVTLSSGETTVTRWPFSSGDALDPSLREPYLTTISGLLQYLPRQEARRLIQFAGALGLRMDSEYLPTLPPPIRFDIDLCCVLESRLLFVSGWIFDPAKELTLAQLNIGGSAFDFLENCLLLPATSPEKDLTPHRSLAQLPRFVFVHAPPERDIQANEATFALGAGAGTMRLTRQVTHVSQDARRDFLALMSKLDPNSVLALVDRIAITLDEPLEHGSFFSLLELLSRNAIERLPTSLLNSIPRYSLEVDLAVRIADKGLFLTGWFSADPSVSARVVCQCGRSNFVISDHWLRQARPDVTSHLASAGIQAVDHLHGFSCYVPLSNSDSPYCISVSPEVGKVQRMRVTVSEKPESALQTVRAVLTSFNSGHPELRLLLERHIGPAVGTAWAARRNPPRRAVVRSYGKRQEDHPPVSIIVPLYGRYDFAEYQMALFADDPEFQQVELIYVVDDPSIFAEFSNKCADLFEFYRVPFVLAFSGANLGFAGANNFGAEVARGHYLLFMNSDVFPKRPLWVGELLRICKSLERPAFVGVKLLYEDGSLQHAGIAFRRYAPWGDLWINDHPFKGLSALGLEGVREVDAVTAACAVIEASLYRQLGGFSEDYIIGDFEDSDLCLRARSAGRRSYVALDVELYHLERQSQNRTGDRTSRINLTIYNCWLHNSRWAKLIEKPPGRDSFDKLA
jgi:GT2 family glycosyltransferase